MLPRRSDGGPLTEADLRLEAAAKLLNAYLVEDGWADDMTVAAVAEHVERARVWIGVAGWPARVAA